MEFPMFHTHLNHSSTYGALYVDHRNFIIEFYCLMLMLIRSINTQHTGERHRLSLDPHEHQSQLTSSKMEESSSEFLSVRFDVGREDEEWGSVQCGK